MFLNRQYPLFILFLVPLTVYLGQGTLWIFNYRYLDPAGNFISRIHPVSYFLFLLSAYHIIKYRGSFSLELKRVALSYATVCTLVFLYSIFAGGSSANGYFIDTLIDPFLILYNLQFVNREGVLKIYRLLLVFFILNSSLAIIERVLSIHFFPIYEASGRWAFRSTAFGGHPLNNTLISTFLCLYFFVHEKGIKRKFILLFLGLIASLSFGGRTGFAILFCSGVILSSKYVTSGVSRYFITLFLLGVSAIGAYYLIFFTELGSRFLEVGVADSSSQVRIDVFNVFRHFTFKDLLMGNPQTKIDNAMYNEEIKIIENFWIIWILKYGIILTLFLSVSLVKFMLRSASFVTQPARIVLVISFLIIASGNLSLASNTMALNIFVLACSVNRVFPIKTNE